MKIKLRVCQVGKALRNAILSGRGRESVCSVGLWQSVVSLVLQINVVGLTLKVSNRTYDSKLHCNGRCGTVALCHLTHLILTYHLYTISNYAVQEIKYQKGHGMI